MKMINIMDINKALDLKNQGFIYKQVQINNKEIYQFVESPELLMVVNNHFSNLDFFISKTMDF